MNNKALELYTRRVNKAKQFFKDNEAILKEWEGVQNEVTDAENQVKFEAREKKMTYGNKDFKVVYSPAWKKWYDVVFLLGTASTKVKKIIQENCLKQEVDRAVFDKLVDQGEIPVELQQEAFREAPMTARVMIKKVEK